MECPRFFDFMGGYDDFQRSDSTIQTEIPAGWVFDPFNSTLTDFVFSRWDQPQEMIAVHVRRASVPRGPAGRRVDRENPAEPGRRSLKDLSSTPGPLSRPIRVQPGMGAARGFRAGPAGRMVVEQRSSLQTAQNVWEPLERAVRTAVSDANLELPEEVGPEEFNRSVQAVNRAFEKDDPDEIEIAIQKSIAVGISTWLHSMAMPDRALEIMPPYAWLRRPRISGYSAASRLWSAMPISCCAVHSISRGRRD